MVSGSEALSILAAPLKVQVLQALSEQPISLLELRRALGHPPATTMRSYLRRLAELGVVERGREDDFPGSVSYAITPSGRRLLVVGEVLREWLRSAPEGAVDLGSFASRGPIKALVDGWSTGIVRALAARPLALTELNRVISQVTYPTLERRLTAMRQVALIDTDRATADRVKRCGATQWLRRAVAPVTAAMGWEVRCIPGRAVEPSGSDAEAAFLLAAPLLELAPEVSGSCRFAVEFRRGPERELAGVTVEVLAGEVRSCVPRIDGQPDAWAGGGVLDWFRRMRGLEASRFETGGELALAESLVRGLREAFLVAPREELGLG